MEVLSLFASQLACMDANWWNGLEVEEESETNSIDVKLTILLRIPRHFSQFYLNVN